MDSSGSQSPSTASTVWSEVRSTRFTFTDGMAVLGTIVGRIQAHTQVSVPTSRYHKTKVKQRYGTGSRRTPDETMVTCGFTTCSAIILHVGGFIWSEALEAPALSRCIASSRWCKIHVTAASSHTKDNARETAIGKPVERTSNKRPCADLNGAMDLVRASPSPKQAATCAH